MQKRFSRIIFVLLIIVVVAFTFFFNLADLNSRLFKPSPHRPDEQEALRIVTSALTFYCNEDYEQIIWPDYHPNESPLIITFDSGNTYAFNLSHPSPIWTEMNFLGNRIQYTQEDLWESDYIQVQNKYLLENRPFFIFHIDFHQENYFTPFLNLLHQRFQAYQKENFENHSRPLCNYLDHLNIENITLMQIEEMVLADFMNAQLDPDKSMFHKITFLSDFLALNKKRCQLMHPLSIRWEQVQQRTHGIADYVAIKTLEKFFLLPDFNGVEHLLAALQVSVVNEEVLERTVKWRHYIVGATLAYALDYIQANQWKTRMTQNDLSPIDILKENITLSDEEVAARLEKIKRRYNYEQVRVQVTKAIEHYQDELSNLERDYVKRQGIPICLNLPPDTVLTTTGSALYTYYLNNGATLSLADTSTQMTQDKQWKIELEGASLVIKNSYPSLATSLKVDLKTQVTIDQANYFLNDLLPGNYFFKDLEIKSRHCNFFSHNHPGQLVFEQGGWKVVYK